MNGIIDALDPTNLLEFTAALSVATRSVGRLRVDRLVAPLVEGVELLTADTYDLQDARENVNWARQSLAALDVADGAGDDTMPWQHLERGLRRHVFANEEIKTLKFREPDGSTRYARTTPEHQKVFLHTLDQLFTTCDEARQYLIAYLHDFQSALDEATRQVRHVVADRMYVEFDRTTKLQDRTDRSVTNSLKTYQNIKQQFSYEPANEATIEPDASDAELGQVGRDEASGDEPQESQGELTLDEILNQPIPGA